MVLTLLLFRLISLNSIYLKAITTHCSLLFEAGATIKEVQERLGHGNVQTTMDTYAH